MEKDEHGFSRRIMLFHYGNINLHDPMFQNQRDTFWSRIKETAHLSPLVKYVKVECISDSRAKIAYKDQGGAIYLPPFDKELQGVTRLEYPNENGDEKYSSLESSNRLQDQTQGTSIEECMSTMCMCGRACSMWISLCWWSYIDLLRLTLLSLCSGQRCTTLKT